MEFLRQHNPFISGLDSADWKRHRGPVYSFVDVCDLDWSVYKFAMPLRNKEE